MIIFLLGASLRFYQLGVVPAGLHRDEAFLGYNALSLLKTGRDMSGNFLPLHLKSFLYSPAGYSYASAPFMAIFGLNSFSVRFASALFGSFTIPLMYFLVLELGSNFKLKIERLALLTALFTALSPWHIGLSRTATENTLVTFFLVLGALLWIKGRILFSFLSFGTTLMLYQAPRAFLPLLIPFLLWLYRPRRIQGVLFLYAVIILLPVLFIVTSPHLSLRIRTVSLFANQNTQLAVDEYLREDGVAGTGVLLSRIFHNKLTSYTLAFLQNYSAHFSYDFLFTDQGLPDRYRIPDQGLLYIIELPLILLGTVELLKSRSRAGTLLLSWLLLVPVGSALAFDDIPNLQRTLIMLPVFSLLSALGLMRVYKKPLRIPLFLFGIYYFAFFLHQYFLHIPLHKPWYRHEGYSQLVSTVGKLLPAYTKAVVTNRESAPAIFFLFFSKYDPAAYIKGTADRGIIDYDRADFGPYEFSQEECPLRIDSKTGRLTGQPGILYVNYGTCHVPSSVRVLGEIRRGDQSLVFQVVTP